MNVLFVHALPDVVWHIEVEFPLASVLWPKRHPLVLLWSWFGSDVLVSFLLSESEALLVRPNYSLFKILLFVIVGDVLVVLVYGPHSRIQKRVPEEELLVLQVERLVRNLVPVLRLRS